jgi:hypothetical protein
MLSHRRNSARGEFSNGTAGFRSYSKTKVSCVRLSLRWTSTAVARASFTSKSDRRMLTAVDARHPNKNMNNISAASRTNVGTGVSNPSTRICRITAAGRPICIGRVTALASKARLYACTKDRAVFVGPPHQPIHDTVRLPIGTVVVRLQTLFPSVLGIRSRLGRHLRKRKRRCAHLARKIRPTFAIDYPWSPTFFLTRNSGRGCLRPHWHLR